MTKAQRHLDYSPFLAFVDTLTCILGSMLLLWMAMVSRPKTLPGFGGGPSFHVRLDSKTGVPEPSLALRIRSSKGVFTVNDYFEKGILIPRGNMADGQAEYRLEFTKGALFEEDDVLLVYLHDLQKRAWGQMVYLEAFLNEKPCSPADNFALTGKEPVLSVSLLALSSGQAQDVKWKRPSP